MTSSITAAPSIEFDPPILKASPNGLFAAIDQGNAWEDIGAAANRFSINGVRIRNINYGSETSTGVWAAGWCGEPGPGESKGGTRPVFPDPFDPITVWAWDACDATAQSRAEVERNAEHWLAVNAEGDVERALAERLLNEAGTPLTSTSLLDAIGQLEAEIAKTGLPGFIHASPYLAPFIAASQNLCKESDGLYTYLNTTWVFGGGYVDGLELTMVATSQPYGWRDAPALTHAMYEPTDSTDYANQFVAVAEQTFAVGYEKLIAAVDVTI